MIKVLVLSFVSAASSARIENWPASLARECTDNRQPDWIFCDDFEEDRSSSYFEGSAASRLAAGTGVAGSQGAGFTFQEGAQDGGSLKIAFGKTPQDYFRAVDQGAANYREMYWRQFLFLPGDWKGNGADKLSRATIFTSATSWAQAMLAHIWSGSDPGVFPVVDAGFSAKLVLDPASGTDAAGNVVSTKYNDFGNLRWLGSNATGYEPFAPDNFGYWHCIEAHVKLNSAGNSDGEFNIWINDEMEAQRKGLNWVGSYSEYGINAVFYENYWNEGSPATQTRYFDNLVISPKRIGCGLQDSSVPPTIASDDPLTGAAGNVPVAKGAFRNSFCGFFLGRQPTSQELVCIASVRRLQELLGAGRHACL